LDYFGVRYYASWLGRWTSVDPGGFVDGLNLYRYALNNPVNGIDAEGYSTESVVEPRKEEKKKEEIETIENNDPLGDAGDEIVVTSDPGNPPKGTGSYEGQRFQKTFTFTSREEEETYEVKGDVYRWHTGSNVRESGWMTEKDYFTMFVDEYNVGWYTLWEEGVAKKGSPIDFNDPEVANSLTVKVIRNRAFGAAVEREMRAYGHAGDMATGKIDNSYPVFEILSFFSTGGSMTALRNQSARILSQEATERLTIYTWKGGIAGRHSGISIGDDFYHLYYDLPLSVQRNSKYYNILKGAVQPYFDDAGEVAMRNLDLSRTMKTSFEVSLDAASRMRNYADDMVRHSSKGLKYGEFTANCTRFCDRVLKSGGKSTGLMTRIPGLNSPYGLHYSNKFKNIFRK
jgi:hypothetical protein